MNTSLKHSENDSLEHYPKRCQLEFKSAVHISALVLGFLIIFANSLVIYLFLKNRTLRRTAANVLLLSLSVTDLVTGVSIFVHILPYYYILLTDCSLVFHTFETTYFASADILTNGLTITSVLHLLLLSSERFVSLYYALRYTAIVTRKRLIVLSIIAWVIGAFVTLIQLSWLVPYIRKPRSRALLLDVRNNDKIYTVTTITLFSFIPMFVLMFEYIWLFCLIRRLVKRESGIHSKTKWSRELKAVIVYCIMFVSFVLFCCPYLLVKGLISLSIPTFMELPSEFFETLFLLRFIISLINPLIYALYKRDFKQAIPKSFGSLPKMFLMNSRPSMSRSGENFSLVGNGVGNHLGITEKAISVSK